MFVGHSLEVQRHLIARVRDARAVLQSAEGIEHSELVEQVAARLFRVPRNRLEPRRGRSPVLCAARKEELRRHHADDLERLRRRFLSDDDPPADHGRIGAEELGPRGVTEQQPAFRARLVVVRVEDAAKKWARSEHFEERA
jgi:hypothetical protein